LNGSRSFARPEFPYAAQGGCADASRGSGDIRAGRLRKPCNKSSAGCAGAGMAAPEPEIGLSAERLADRVEILRFLRKRLGRPSPGGKANPPRRPVGDDMHSVEVAPAGERGGHLPCDRAVGIASRGVAGSGAETGEAAKPRQKGDRSGDH